MHYDLTCQPWLPVRTKGGARLRLGLRDVLLRAHDLARLEDPSPLVEVALYRLLCALAGRILAGPVGVTDAVRLWRSGRFPEELLDAYWGTWEDRFDLFDEAHPFLQVPGFAVEVDKRSPISRLAPERSSGHNKTLFDHGFDAMPPALAPDEAARLLVGHQAFAVGGGKSPHGYLQDAPAARAALVLIEGDNLFETLLQNLVPVDPEVRRRDVPVWEWTDFSATASPVGPLQLYTWPSRRLRLHPEEDHGSVVVRYISYAAGWPARTTQEDPMAAYVDDRRRGPQVLGIDADRGFWRDYRTLVAGLHHSGVRSPLVVRHADMLVDANGESVSALRASVFGQAAHQGKVEAWRREHYPIPTRLLDPGAPQFFEILHQAFTQTEAVATQCIYRGGRALAAALLTASDRRSDPDAVRDLYRSLSIEAAFWSHLELGFPDLLNWIETATDDGSQAFVSWRRVVREAVEQAFDGAEVLLGRDGRTLRAVAQARRLWRPALARWLGDVGGGVA